MIAIFISVALAVLLLASALFRKHSDPQRGEDMSDAWDRALRNEESQVARMLLSVSRPIGTLPQVTLQSESSLYKMLRLKLNSGGNLYGGSVEVFLSVQVTAVLIAVGGLLSAILLQAAGPVLAASALFAVAFVALPYNRISTAAKERVEAVTAALPEFAELLMMPVTSGYSILPALDFTATRLEGPVASEVRMLLQVLSSRAASEHQAFIDAGERLGTPAAVTFFTTLYQSYADGTRIADTMKGQAEQLRKQAFERTRAKLKALPNKLVIIMGLHLIPFLFAVVLLPTFVALGKM